MRASGVGAGSGCSVGASDVGAGVAAGGTVAIGGSVAVVDAVGSGGVLEVGDSGVAVLSAA